MLILRTILNGYIIHMANIRERMRALSDASFLMRWGVGLRLELNIFRVLALRSHVTYTGPNLWGGGGGGGQSVSGCFVGPVQGFVPWSILDLFFSN
jgi:hypothetical protein